MSIFYLVFLTLYISSLCVALAFMGINWNRIDTKYKRSPQRLLILIYVINFVLLYYGFGVPFMIQLLINILEIAAVFFGT